MSETPWMDLAQAYLDKKVREVRGGENPDILKFFREINKPEFKEDEVPWCAAFVGAMLYETNQGHNGSAWAAHYGTWDGADRVERRSAQRGDIMVMTRQGGGHVCFLEKDNGDGTFQGLGGNQNDEVNITRQSWGRVTYVMRPNGNGTPKLKPEDAAKVPEYVGKPAVTPTEIAVGVGGGAVALSAGDWITGIVVVLIVVGIVAYIWYRRRKA